VKNSTGSESQIFALHKSLVNPKRVGFTRM